MDLLSLSGRRMCVCVPDKDIQIVFVLMCVCIVSSSVVCVFCVDVGFVCM